MEELFKSVRTPRSKHFRYLKLASNFHENGTFYETISNEKDVFK
eukprot:UN06218